MAQITLSQFERIDGLMSSLLRMGEFETCADPRGYIATENRLFDACVDAFGYATSDAYASGLDWAAETVAKALIGTLDVVDPADAAACYFCAAPTAMPVRPYFDNYVRDCGCTKVAA